MNQIPAKSAMSFREVYEAHVGLVQFVLRSFRLSEEERDELVQEVFLRLLQSMDRIDPLKIKGFLSIGPDRQKRTMT